MRLAAATDGVGSYEILVKATWGESHRYEITSVVPDRRYVAGAENIPRPAPKSSTPPDIPTADESQGFDENAPTVVSQ